VADVIERKFIPQLERAIYKDLQNQTRKLSDDDLEIGVGKAQKSTSKAPKTNEDGEPMNSDKMIDDEASEDDRESDDEQDEGDASSSKRKAKKTQQLSYDDDEEEEDGDSDEEMEDSTEDKDEDGKSRLDRITDTGKYVCDFKFDQKNGQWCDIAFKVINLKHSQIV
jgi:DNA-directed RNA polymerase I subunit RPA1